MSELVKCDGCKNWGSRRRRHIAPDGWRFLRLRDEDRSDNEFYLYACSPECVARIAGAWEIGPGMLDAPPPEGSLLHSSPKPGQTTAEELEALRDGVAKATDALIAALEAPPVASDAAGPKRAAARTYKWTMPDGQGGDLVIDGRSGFPGARVHYSHGWYKVEAWGWGRNMEENGIASQEKAEGLAEQWLNRCRPEEASSPGGGR